VRRPLGAALALLLLVPTLAHGATPERVRRPKLPPPPPLPRALAVDEFEFFLKASRTRVGAGVVTIRVYNRGEDDHNIVLVDKQGLVHHADLKPGAKAVLTPTLSRGTYVLYCDLFAGTKDSHYDLGMRVTLEVR
jgi:hypothetical protein